MEVSWKRRRWLFAVLYVLVLMALYFVTVPKREEGFRILSESRRKAAPPFLAEDTGGKLRSLSDFQQKLLVLNFWAPWCPPCVEEMPSLEKLHRNISSFGTVIGMDIDQAGKEKAMEFLKKVEVSFPILLDPGGKVAASYGTFRIPETYILDKKGRIAARVIGPRDWSDPSIEKALRELASEEALPESRE